MDELLKFDQSRVDELKKYHKRAEREQTDPEREQVQSDTSEMPQKASTMFYSIGYGGLSNIDHLAQIMEHNDIAKLMDVRSKPNTRRFSREQFENAFGNNYKSRPEMGGFDHEINQFEGWQDVAEEGIIELISNAQSGNKTMIMCAEKNPDKCHRKYFVSKALEQRGYAVKHL